jgi:hypothetical protein
MALVYVLWERSGVGSVYWHKQKWLEGGWVSILTQTKVTGGALCQYTDTNTSHRGWVGLVHVLLDFWTFDFRTTRIFIHYKFSPLIHLSCAKFGWSFTADKQTFWTITQCTVCQPRIVFNFLLTSSSRKLVRCHHTVLLSTKVSYCSGLSSASQEWILKHSCYKQ